MKQTDLLPTVSDLAENNNHILSIRTLKKSVNILVTDLL